MWHFGNTSVRSALRLREGLIALKNSGKEGQIRGKEGDQNFRDLLGNNKVVNLGSDDSFSLGRKWRSAMEKMGFINVTLKGDEKAFQENIGKPDYVSKNGQRLIDAGDDIRGQNECFLRSLCAYYIDYDGICSPFIFTLKILNSLLHNFGDSKLSMHEMALIVQCSGPKSNTDEVVNSIIRFRKKREEADSKLKFDREYYLLKAKELNKKESTFRDYADTNFRYLKATGVISSSGRGIAIVPEKLSIVKKIIHTEDVPYDNYERYKRLCFGSTLPTDNIELARNYYYDLRTLLLERGDSFNTSEIDNKNVEQTNIEIRKIEDRLFKYKQIDFAKDQKFKTKEISLYMDILLKPSSKTVKRILDEETEIEIPAGERPVYFEWIIWRAFLAMYSVKDPWKGARFKMDPADFKPLSHAPGGKADFIIELENIILVVEVTLSTSSRQEAAEGEPVRRHVAATKEEYKSSDKKVFGLFIALSIDTNTANTFRIGEWYLHDEKLTLDIVPLTLKDFKLIFDAVRDKPSRMHLFFQDFLEKCRADSKLEAPEWKKKISHNCNSLVEKISLYD